MKKFLVIGNPIDHSLSPKLHNHWIKENGIEAVYDKKKLEESDIEDIVSQVRLGDIDGVNITVPFKKSVIPFLDRLSPVAEKAQSVNTIYRENGEVVGDNTDIGGFKLSIKHIDYNVENKTVLILGAGGVVSSIIIALEEMGASKIILSNRTKEKAERLQKQHPKVEIVDWGEIVDFDMIINATSLGLKDSDEIKIDYSKIGENKLFYDVIYNPSPTKFLSKAKELGHQTENGKMMFVYQAQEAFTLWHNITPKIDDEVVGLVG